VCVTRQKLTRSELNEGDVLVYAPLKRVFAMSPNIYGLIAPMVMIISLERGADCLHIVRLIPLHPKTPSSLASFESRLVLPFWYQVVLEMGPLNGCNSGGRSSSSSTYGPLWTKLKAINKNRHRAYDKNI